MGQAKTDDDPGSSCHCQDYVNIGTTVKFQLAWRIKIKILATLMLSFESKNELLKVRK